MPAFGVYPIADALNPGDEISSTYEGRHVTVLESDLIHPTHADIFVDKGDPVVFGTTGLQAVGVAFQSAAATGDYIAIDTEGIWNLDVVAVTDGAANSAVAGGDLLYINVGTAVISKITNQATQIPFGYALGVIAGGSTLAIAVKVHFDPSLDNAKRTYITVATGAYVYGKHHTSIFAGGESTGLEYFDQQVTGTQTGEIYGWGTWMELASGFTAITGRPVVAAEFGIYDASADLTAAYIAMLQIQGQFAANPLELYLCRINITDVGGPIDAMFAATNPGSVGYTAGALAGATKLGGIPFCRLQGVTHYIYTYDAPD